MQDLILSPISLENFELLIKKSVTAAIAQIQPNSQDKSEEKNFSISELANYLNCTKATVQAYKSRGVFPYYQTGRKVFFKKSEVDKALEVKKQKRG